MFLKTVILKKRFLLLSIVLPLLVLSLTLNKPFIGHHDFTNAFDGVIAKNYLKYGFIHLKFGQIASSVSTIDSSTSYFTHYPPLLPVLIALSFLTFGVSEWAVRLIPLFFSIAGTMALFLIAEKLWNKRVAVFSVIFFCLNPMFIYFGNMAVPEPIIVSFCLIATFLYLRYLDKKTVKNMTILCVTLFAGGLIGWPLLYLGPLFICHSLVLKKFSKALLLPMVTLMLTVFLMLLHAYILTGSFFGGGLLETLISRISAPNLNFGGSDFTLYNYLRQEITILQSYFTRIMVSFSLLYLILTLKSTFDLKKTTVYLLLLFGLGHPVLFSRYTFIHDFLNIYLLPFFALSAALGLNLLYDWFTKRKYSKTLLYTIVTILLTAFIFERISFTKALIKTDMNKSGLEMATTINSLNPKSNEVAVISPRFNDFFGVFTNFYVNNPYTVTDWNSIENPNTVSTYRYLILIDEDIKNRVYYDSLVKNYKSAKINDKTIIYTYEKR